jgi:hypothetical protein
MTFFHFADPLDVDIQYTYFATLLYGFDGLNTSKNKEEGDRHETNFVGNPPTIATTIDPSPAHLPGSIVFPVHFSILHKLVVGNLLLDSLHRREMIMDTIHFPLPRRSRCMTHTESKLIIGKALHQQLNQSALADPGRTAKDHRSQRIARIGVAAHGEDTRRMLQQGSIEESKARYQERRRSSAQGIPPHRRCLLFGRVMSRSCSTLTNDGLTTNQTSLNREL